MSCLPRAEEFFWRGLEKHLPPRFLDKMEVDENGCWIWTGSTNNGRYGQIKWGKNAVVAHRVSYEAFYGPVPEGLQIDHYRMNDWDTKKLASGEIFSFPNQRKAPCSQRCVAPLHLEVISQRENLIRFRATESRL